MVRKSRKNNTNNNNHNHNSNNNNINSNSNNNSNNNNNWRIKRFGNKSRGNRGWCDGNNQGNKKNFKPNGGRERQFRKFVDTDHNIRNESNCWPVDNWNSDNLNYTHGSRGDGIYPWISQNPPNPIVIPQQHVHFEKQNENMYHDQAQPYSNNIQAMEQREQVSVQKPVDREIKLVSMSSNNTLPSTNKEIPTESPKVPVQPSPNVKIKQEKNVKQEHKSSSSSSSDESSSDENPDSKDKTVIAKETPKPPLSPLNIKLKPKPDCINATPGKTPTKLPVSERSSTESSSDEGSAPNKPAATPDNTQKMEDSKAKPGKNKTSSEDDVVCIGKLENKIVLEDESHNDNDENETDEETTEKTSNRKCTGSNKRVSEKCMICDKIGHTSFQCQMICKNCSAPYHGYRTCPLPANLNTMLQLFMEFCMQQFRNFNADKQLGTSPGNSVPMPQVDSPHSGSVLSKLSKLKHKQVKSNGNKGSKRRKISSSKKFKSRTNSDDSSEDNSDEDDTDSVTTESEESPAESIVSSKKKRKMKSKLTSKLTNNLQNFTNSPASLPMVLNSFPNLTVPTPSLQNPNTSTNALNTLLLTQMFQNAIGSLK